MTDPCLVYRRFLKVKNDLHAFLNDKNELRLKKFEELQKVIEKKIKKEYKKKSYPESPKEYLLLQDYNELKNPYIPSGSFSE